MAFRPLAWIEPDAHTMPPLFVSPHFPWQMKAILIATVAVAIAMPFGRREDWIGWLAFLVMAASAVGLWAILIWGFTQRIIDWWRGRSDSD